MKEKERSERENALEARATFLERFRGLTGRIVDGDGDIVVIVSVALSCDDPRRRDRTNTGIALVVKYRSCDKDRNATRRRGAKLARHVEFPLLWRGRKVLYRRA